MSSTVILTIHTSSTTDITRVLEDAVRQVGGVDSAYATTEREDNASERNYWGTVQAIADDLYQRGRDGEIADFSDALFEAIDGTQWIIYTYRARKVMQYTRNDDALEDHGVEAPTGGYDEVTTAYAFWAMYQDVIDRLENDGHDVNDIESWSDVEEEEDDSEDTDSE